MASCGGHGATREAAHMGRRGRGGAVRDAGRWRDGSRGLPLIPPRSMHARAHRQRALLLGDARAPVGRVLVALGVGDDHVVPHGRVGLAEPGRARGRGGRGVACARGAVGGAEQWRRCGGVTAA
eukprot:1837351-Prymnesium_polylepis.2